MKYKFMQLMAALVALLGMTAGAQAGDLSLSLVGNPPIGPGENFSVAVRYGGTEHISAYALKVHFNSVQTELVGVDFTNVVNGSGAFSGSVGAAAPDAGIAETDTAVVVSASSTGYATTPGFIGKLNFVTQPGYTGLLDFGVSDSDPANTMNLVQVSAPAGPDVAHAFTPFARVIGLAYVNKSWAGSTPGAEKGTNQFFGVNAFATVQTGVDGVASGGKVSVAAATYQEYIVLTKPVTLSGVGKPRLDSPTGGDKTKKAIIRALAPDITFEGFLVYSKPVDGYHGLYAGRSATDTAHNFNNLIVRNNEFRADCSTSFFSSNKASVDHIGVRLEGLTTPYPSALVENNTFTRAGASTSFGAWGKGIRSATSGGVYTGNTIQSGSQDIYSSGNQVPLTISNNTFQGKCVDIYGCVKDVTVTGNIFDSIGTTNADYMFTARANKSQTGGKVFLDGNTFRNHKLGVWVGNSKNIFIRNNIFEALNYDFVHVRVDTGMDGGFSTVGSNSVSITGNRFDGWGTVRGTALELKNTQAAATPDPDWSSIVVGGPGTEANTFDSKLKWYVNEASPFNYSLDLSENIFNGKRTDEMSLTELCRVEDKVYHKLDASNLATAYFRPGNLYVTNPTIANTPSGASTDSVIQRGVDAATDGDVVNLEAAAYLQTVNLNKAVTLAGPQAGVCAAVQEGGEATVKSSNATPAITLSANGATVDGLSLPDSAVAIASAFGVSGIVRNSKVTGTGVGVWVEGAVSVRECRIENNDTGVQMISTADASLSTLANNHIRNNTSVGVRNYGTGSMMATGNWWGEAMGPLDAIANPTGRGDSVTAGVVYDPWYDKGVFLNDRDGDGIWNALEDVNLDNVHQTTETAAMNIDTDGDGFEDGVEARNGSDPLLAASTPPAGFPYDSTADSDGDKFRDNYEYALGSDPSLASSRPVLGDTNDSGGVSIADVSRLRKWLAGVPTSFDYHDRMDLNRDGVIDAADVAILRSWLADPAVLLPQ